MIKRALTGLLVALLATPSAVLAQATKAGVVTTLEGNVTARRIALPDPVPLKFKDDVFLQDTVTTGDQSLARMLLGGKAVVTVRERSVLTITEVPGKSTIDLESGKFALAVPREKMRPGEEIQIRTPNAVAGVRGTVVITEVERQGAQVTGGLPAVVTNFHVLRGSITAQPLDATRNPLGTPVPVGSMQTYSGVGLATPRVQPLPADQLTRVTSGLQSSQKRGGDAGKDDVKTQHMHTAVALLRTLAGGTPHAKASAPTRTYASTAYVPPYIPKVDKACKGAAGSTSSSCEDLAKFLASQSAFASQSAIVSFDGDFTSLATDPLFALVNGFLTMQTSFRRITQNGNVSLAGPLAKFTSSSIFAGGSLLEIQGGKLTSTGVSALLGVDPTLIATAKSLILMNGGILTLAGPVLTDLNGTILTGGAFLDMSNGATLSDTSTNPLVQLNGTAIAAASALRMANATMKLAGPLVTLTNPKSVDPATIATALTLLGLNANALSAAPTFLLDQKSALTSTGKAPLIQFTSMGFDNNENFIRIDNSSTVNLAGSLLKFTDAQVTSRNVNRSFVVLINGSSLTTTGTSDPLFQFVGTASGKSSVTSARDFFAAAVNGTTLSPTMTLSGPLLSATLTTLSSGDPTANTFSLVFLGDGARVQSTSAQPFMSFQNSSVRSAGNLLTLRRSTVGAPARLILAGPLVAATNSTFNTTSLGLSAAFGTTPAACCNLFFTSQAAQLSSTTTSALIQLSNSTVIGNSPQSGGNFFGVTDSFVGAPAGEVVASASVSLAGPLLSSINSTITELFSLVFVQRSTLSSTTGLPLISMNGGTMTLGGTNAIDGSNAFGRVLTVLSSNTSGLSALGASATLAGPVLSMTNGATLNAFSDIVGVLNGARLTSTTTNPMVSVTNSTVNQTPVAGFGSGVLNVGGLGSTNGTVPATVTMNGSLLLVDNGGQLNFPGRLVQIFAGGQVVGGHPTDSFITVRGGNHTAGTFPSFGLGLFGLFGRSTNTALDTDPLITGIGGSITVGTDQPLQLSGSGAVLQVTQGATLNTQQVFFMDTMLLSATMPLLQASGGGTLTTTSDAINLNQKAKLTATGPLFKIDGSTVNVTGSLFRLQNGSGMAVTGDLLSLVNAGKLNITNGGAIFASGGSLVNVTGAFVNFGTGGGTITINNTNGTNLCLSFCSTIGGVPFFTSGGASVSTIGGPGTTIKGVGTINTNLNGVSSILVPAVIATGAGTVVNFQGN